MSTPFYDLASLVVVPSGYKSGKIYAQKPLTTDGQLTFTRASTATRVNASGLIESVASGVPRLDYLGSTCPKLLLEPQRSNLCLYSEQFDNAPWALYNGTQVANTTETLDPSGYYGAEKVIMGVGNTATYRQSIGGLTNGATYTFSLYIKQGSGVTAFLDICDASSTVDITPTSQWVRYTKTGVWNTTFNFVDIELRGTSGSYCYIWGAQLEAGAYATSYIPTTSAAVTRLADMSGTTNYFGAQTFAGNFTFFVDLLPMEGNTGISDAMILGGGDYNGGGNYQSYLRFVNGNIILKGVAEVGIIDRSYTMTANQQYKILVTRTGTTVKIFANGAQVGASATSSATVILRSLGWSYAQANYNYDGRINQVLLMPNGLTDAQSIELTTL